MDKIPVIFLDRDGVINSPARPHEYITRREDFVILPGVYEALRLLRGAGFRIFVVTNQRCIARGIATSAEIDALHGWMTEDFAANGCFVDGVFVCPHGDDDNCDCRKPKPGLLVQVQRHLEEAEGVTVDKTHSWMIGDSVSDEQAGISYGVNTVLIGGECSRGNDGRIHITARDILDSSRKILEGRN